jgi:lipopolysaccharide export system protein LptC
VLHFVGSRSLVRSEGDVRITEARQVISGRGLEYDMDAGRMALREQVRGSFEPNKKNP